MQSVRETCPVHGGLGLRTWVVRSLALATLLVACAQTDDTDTDSESDTEAATESDTEADTTAPIDDDQDGYAQADDCDDLNPDVHPGADEICNGIDDDCDDVIDTDAIDRVVVYADADEDGYGDPATEQLVCAAGEGTVDNSDDCDDADTAIHPQAQEVCDMADVDEDCDELADDVDPSVDVATMGTWFADADADGFGNPDVSVVACDAPGGFVADNTDCGDDDAAANPELGCPGPWDGLWQGDLTIGVTAPSLGLSDQCTVTADLVIEAPATPQLDLAGGTPLSCMGSAQSITVSIAGDFIDEDTVDATLIVDGDVFGMTIELAAPDQMSASGSENTIVAGVVLVVSHDLSATRQ